MVKWFVVVGVCFAILAGVFGTYTSAHDTNVQYMADIKRLNKGSESELSNYTLKIKEMAQVPSMYTRDLQKVVKTYFDGKNDKQAQNAVFAFMQERVPNFNPKMYEMLMVTMNAGRDAFNNAQKRKVDVCQNHEAFRNKFTNSLFLGEFKPDAEYEKMCRVVSDATTRNAFETGIQEEVKLM